MFRGFEIILRGKDPQAGLIMTPRICGICGGSHLYKACYALDTAWKTCMPPNATWSATSPRPARRCSRSRAGSTRCSRSTSSTRSTRSSKDYDEAVRRFAPFVGESYEPGVVLGRRSRSRCTRSSADSGRTRAS
jgi:hypothetical protein